MAESNSEGVNIAVVEESTQGDSPPPSTGWTNLEADAIGDPGPAYKKMARSPFTITRQLRRPFISGLDCALSLDLDAIKDHIDIFGEGMFKSEWQHSGGTDQSKFLVTEVVDGGGSADEFTVAADGDFAANSLIVARGFAEPENNGLFVVTTGSTSTAIKVPTATLVAEASPPANATVDFAGFQFASGDLQIDSNGDLITSVKDLTSLGLSVHQWIYLASELEQDSPHVFADDDNYGFAEVIAIATNKLTLRRRSNTWVADSGAGKTIRLFFTKWVRDVARSHEDEKLVSYAFEVTYSDLGDGPADAYENLLGYILNDVTFDMPAEGKVTMQITFIGQSASDPSTTRLDGPDDAINVVTSLALSTAADITRLSVDNVDESGLMTDFQTLKLMLKNNVVPEKAVGTLGNRFTPLGVFEANAEGDVYFVTPDIVTAVHDNRILRLAAGMRNDDFGMLIDIPSLGAMEAPKKIEHNKLITIASKTSGFVDSLGGFTAGMSVFAFLPMLAPGIET